MTEARHTLHDGPLAVGVLSQGAELCSLHHAEAGELLWQAGAAWPRYAPVLFPIVGRLNGDALRHAGRTHRLGQHGFARDRRFAWEARDTTSCRLVLQDDDQTRAAFPFAFRLALGYALRDGALHVRYAVTNPGTTVLPCSLGAHPAFRWPLLPGTDPEAHRLVFDRDEPAPVRRLQDGLLRPEPEPSPVRGRTLALSRALFAADALILDRPASRSLRYLAGEGAGPAGSAGAIPATSSGAGPEAAAGGAGGVAGLELGWDGFPQLGLWSRAGGDFLCLEPWHGMADPVGFDGDFATKPGLMLIPPGATRELGWWVRVLPA